MLAEAAGGDPAVILIATGSEVQIALAARDELQAGGTPTRVVSMPCVEWFTSQDVSYQREVLPPQVRARVCIEAGVALGWRAFAGDAGECVSLEHFGASSDYQDLYEHFGFTAEKRPYCSSPAMATNAEPSQSFPFSQGALWVM